MLKCKRCGRIIKEKENRYTLDLTKHFWKPFAMKKVVRVDRLCDECIDEYNKFFIGEE